MPAAVLSTAAKISEVSAKAVEKVAEVKEVAIKEVAEGSVTVQPDIEAIKSKSLESIMASNIEKAVTTETPTTELQPISEELKQKLKEEGLLSETVIDAIQVDSEGNYIVDNCVNKNKELVGKAHPETGVTYAEKCVDFGSIQLKVVVPEFPFKFALDIPKEIWKEGDDAIFKYCTKQLKEAIQANPELASQFTDRQLMQIMKGEPHISGLTWHHTEIPGKMQLVDFSLHSKSAHLGGNSLWCGGIRLPQKGVSL